MGGPDSPRPANWPPPQITNKPWTAEQHVRPPNVPPIWGLSAAARALTALPPASHAAGNRVVVEAMGLRGLTSTRPDLSASFGQALGRFRNDVEGSLKQLERDTQLLLLPQCLSRSGDTLAADTAMDTSSEESLEEQEQQGVEQALELDTQQTRSVRFNSIPSVTLNAVDRDTSPEPIRAALQGQQHHQQSRGQTSVERLKAALTSHRATAFTMNKVDKCVSELLTEPPQNPLIHELSQFRFNAGQLVAPDSRWRTLAAGKRYSILRGIAVLIDFAVVICETALTTQAVADRREVPHLPVMAVVSLMLCTFFILDMVFALALEFPRFDLFVGRTGQRSLNLFAIMQQTLVLIGMFSFPHGRFTSMFRIFVQRFSFLRVLRALVTIPGMGGKRLQRSIAELYIMIRALAGTLQPLVWCTMLVSLVLAIFGTFLAESTAVRISRAFDPTEVLPEGSPQDLLLHDWGGMRRCIYSLLLTIFGGADWGDLLASLIGFGEGADSLICFMIFIFFTFIALLNTVTAVFIQCAFVRLEKDRVFAVQREVQQKREYLMAAKEAFVNMCGHSDGKVQQQDMVLYLRDPEARAAFQRLHLDTDEVEKLFLLMDTDRSDGITLQEFMTGCLRLRGAASTVHLEFVHQDFKYAIHTLSDIMGLLQRHTEILTTPRTESPSSAKQAQQLSILQRGLRLLSEQLRGLDITVQEGLSRSQSQLDLDPELKSEPTLSF